MREPNESRMLDGQLLSEQSRAWCCAWCQCKSLPVCFLNRDKELEKDTNLRNLSENMLKHGQVCMATSNLYSRCCKKSNISHPPDESNPINQLNVVGHFVG